MKFVRNICAFGAAITCLTMQPVVGEHVSGRKCQCAECTKICCPEKVTTKEKESCWEVECKEVCIPPVRFPWMKCWPLSCGRVRVVNALKKEETEIEKCEIQWQVKDCCPRCSKPFGLCRCH